MTNTLEQLSFIQYNNICQHWRIIELLIHKLNHLNYSKNETIEVSVKNLIEKLDYHQKEYEKYISEIGLHLNDQTYDDMLFKLLNNGIADRKIC